MRTHRSWTVLSALSVALSLACAAVAQDRPAEPAAKPAGQPQAGAQPLQAKPADPHAGHQHKPGESHDHAQDRPQPLRPTVQHPPGPGRPNPTTQPTTGPAPKIQLEVEEWDFGTVTEGDEVKREVGIKNVGEGPLTLFPPRASCGCTAAKPGKDVLQPGESTSAAVTLNSLKRKGDTTVTVTFASNDPARPEVMLRLKGHIKSLLDIKPPTGVAFGRITADQKETREVEITNMSGKPVKLEMQPPGPGAESFDVKIDTVEEGQKYKVVISTKPPLKEQNHQTTVVLKTGMEKIPEVRVTASALVAPRVSVSPTTLNVSPLSPRPQERPVIVTYSADKPIKITSMKVTGSDKITVEANPLTTTRPQIDKFLYHNLRVKLPPGSEIPESGVEVVIETDDPEYPKLIVPVKRLPVPARRPVATSQPVGPRSIPLDRQGRIESTTRPAAPAGGSGGK